MSEEIALRAIIPTMSQIIGLACIRAPDKEKPAKCGFVLIRFIFVLAYLSS
jgi:hypothetical protein